MIEKIKNFLKEVKVEMSKVVWPTRQELINSTIIILIVTAFFSIFIGLNDFIFNHLIKIIF
jgi:preprotein translocase subunit SecE